MSKFFPEWLEDFRVADDLFAQAYEGMPGELRAWVKQTAARLHAMERGMRSPVEALCSRHRHGFSYVDSSHVGTCAVLFLDDTCVSASKVAAAAVPMVLSGVEHFCAVRVGQGEPVADEVLAALELSGVESVYQVSEEVARSLTAFLTENRSASLLFQGQGEALGALAVACGYASPPLRLWKPFAVERVGVWAGDGADWDWNALVWANPCVMLDVYGATGDIEKESPQIIPQEGDFSTMLEAGYTTLYVPDSRLREVCGNASLALGTGHEGCWVWPNLQSEFFRRRVLAIGSENV